MWQMHDGWGWWMASGWLWMIVLWALIIWGIARLARGDDRARRASTREQTPLEILEQRYAGGELTDEQFESMRRHLTGTRMADRPADRESGT